MTGSWWLSSLEEMTCVSSAMTAWVAHSELWGLFCKESKRWWHGGQCSVPQSNLMISPFKMDRSLEQNNKALWTEPRLFQRVSGRGGRTRFLFLANSVIPKNKSPLHKAKSEGSGVNSASTPSSFLSFCHKIPFSLTWLQSHAALTGLCIFNARVWSRISKQNINVGWALRLQLWYLGFYSCCLHTRECCTVSACLHFVMKIAWGHCWLWLNFDTLLCIMSDLIAVLLFRPPCHLRTTAFIWKQAWICSTQR